MMQICTQQSTNKPPTPLALAEKTRNQPIINFLKQKIKEETHQEGGQKRKASEETPLEQSTTSDEPPRKKSRVNTEMEETQTTTTTTSANKNASSNNSTTTMTTTTTAINNNRQNFIQPSISPISVPRISYNNTPLISPMMLPALNNTYSLFNPSGSYNTPSSSGFYNHSSSLNSMYPFKPANTLLLATPNVMPMPTPTYPAPISTPNTTSPMSSYSQLSSIPSSSSSALTATNTSSTISPFPQETSPTTLLDANDSMLFENFEDFFVSTLPLTTDSLTTDTINQLPSTKKEESSSNKPLPFYMSDSGYNPSLFATSENNTTTPSNPAPVPNGKTDKSPADKSITQFNHDEMMQVIKILRGKNNCNSNCIALALDVIKYFLTKEMPTKHTKTTKHSTNDFNVILHTDILIAESTNDRYAEITKSTIFTLGDDFPPLTPGAPMTPCDPHTPDSHLSVEQKKTEPKETTKLYRQRSALYDDVNDELKKKAASEPNQVSFGIVNLGRSLKVNDELSEEKQLNDLLNMPGHMLCYFATPTEVWYIDCQLYNGKTKKNDAKCGPIYSNLSDAHTFSNTATDKDNDTFGDTVFYIPINPRLALKAEPAKTLGPFS